MTGSIGGPRGPGATLLRIARLFFRDDVISAVVQPAISDLQCEVADAGPKRFGRLRARWRGYGAFWKLALVIPFTRWPAAAGNAGTVTFPDVVGRLAVGSAAFMLLAVAGPLLGAWFAAVAVAAGVLAVVIHRWYDRHPSDIPDPTDRHWQRPPQINFSSTEVPANSGGLIFVLGTVLIVAVGLPSAVWFLLAGAAGGCVVAWVLVRRRRLKSQSGSPGPRHYEFIPTVDG